MGLREADSGSSTVFRGLDHMHRLVGQSRLCGIITPPRKLISFGVCFTVKWSVWFGVKKLASYLVCRRQLSVQQPDQFQCVRWGPQTMDIANLGSRIAHTEGYRQMSSARSAPP